MTTLNDMLNALLGKFEKDGSDDGDPFAKPGAERQSDLPNDEFIRRVHVAETRLLSVAAHHMKGDADMSDLWHAVAIHALGCLITSEVEVEDKNKQVQSLREQNDLLMRHVRTEASEKEMILEKVVVKLVQHLTDAPATLDILDPYLAARIDSLLVVGDGRYPMKIDAIRMFRDTFYAGLHEAKCAIEARMKMLGAGDQVKTETKEDRELRDLGIEHLVIKPDDEP